MVVGRKATGHGKGVQEKRGRATMQVHQERERPWKESGRGVWSREVGWGLYCNEGTGITLRGVRFFEDGGLRIRKEAVSCRTLVKVGHGLADE